MFLLLTYFGLILGVAFLVLTERAVLGLAQSRKGPNVVGPWGVIQCVADGVKLMTKGNLSLSPTSKILYSLSPILLTVLTMILISMCPMPLSLSLYGYSMLMLFCVLSLLSLPFMLLGFSYGSVYSTTGAVRVVGLMMSYEILLLLLMLFFKGSFGSWTWGITGDMNMSSSNYMSRILLVAPMLVLWLMELGRTPFDLAEGESELVSGFNVEYGGWGFLFFFFSEMLCLLSMSLMFSVVILQLSSIYTHSIGMLFFVVVSLYVRAALPRFRLLDTQNFIWFRLTPWVMTFGCLTIFLTYL
uniref:NADH-ubiquinone oxidoreductase chain 1 n=1 Tax=Salpa thompsoni TaxID=569448 RepID=A0A2Z5U2W3_9UROC|nr:NADH dehydrogenase subunit 1 [Salpa thompsoni]